MISIRTLYIKFVIISVMMWPVMAEDHDHDHDHGHRHAFEGTSAFYLSGHGDFEIGLHEGELELHIHLHAGTVVDGNALDEDTSFEPQQLTVVATEEAEILCPAGDAWEPTGVDVNEPLWVLPQHEKEGLPAFGFSTEEIDAGLLVNDRVQLKLRAIQGPGDFCLWEDNAFGLPSFYISTHKHQLSASFPIGLHAHFNWSFSAPGDYILIFEACGDMVAGGAVEALSIYHFKVTENPITLKPLIGDVNSDGIVDEHDLHIVEDNLGHSSAVWPAGHDHESDHDHETTHDH